MHETFLGRRVNGKARQWKGFWCVARPPGGLERARRGETRVPKNNPLSRRAKLHCEVRSGTSSDRLFARRSGSIKPGFLRQHGAQGTSAMLLGHQRLEIGRGMVVGFTLTGSPFHKQAVAQAPKHPQDPNAIGRANATSIIVVRYIQPLMRAAFNSPGKSIELEPFLSGQLLRLRTGHQRNQFVFAAFDLP